jgi:Zn-dependent metalloprotease
MRKSVVVIGTSVLVVGLTVCISYAATGPVPEEPAGTRTATDKGPGKGPDSSPVVAVEDAPASGTTGQEGGSPASGGTPVDPAQAVNRARIHLKKHRSAIGAASGDAYAVKQVIGDRGGTSHVRFARTFRGVAVAGGDFVIHNAPDGQFAGLSAGSHAPLSIDTTPKVTSSVAASAARKAFDGSVAKVGKPKLLIDATGATSRLTWESVVEGMRPDGQTPSRLHVFTDAVTGAVLSTQDEVRSVAGVGKSQYSGTVTVDATQSGGSYELRDPERGKSYTCDMRNTTTGTCTVLTDTDNTWGSGSASDRQTAAVDAHYGSAKTFDYFKKTFGRNGIFGNGKGIPSRVHYGNNYANAFWDGSKMTYGDGSRNSKPLVALDVVAHEMSHGLSQSLISLGYSGETGGLNEATSDIFGTMVEFYAASSADPGDYEIGEKLDLRGNGKPLRYMYDPTLDGASDGCWSSSTGSKNVHYSAGVGNHFFFMLAEGSGSTQFGTSPVCRNAPAVTGIGRTDAAAIWYRALERYFTSSTKYKDTSSADNDARNYTLKAATELFGTCSRQYRSVQSAWTAVNVAGEDAACSGTPTPTSASGTTSTSTPGTTSTSTSGTTSTSTSGTTSTSAPGTTSTSASGTTSTSTPGTTSTSTPATPTGTGSCAPATNSRQVRIPDRGPAVTSSVTMAGCDRKASSSTKVRVHITHPFRGDLVLTLVAPDGSTYRLKNANGRDNKADVNSIFTLDTSKEKVSGTWRLKVQDVFRADRGTLTSWTLTA